MKVRTLVDIKNDEHSYTNYHVKYDDSKAFVTSTEGFWEQTEYPIIRVEKRTISSKNIIQLYGLEEKQLDVACIIYSEVIDETVVDKTLTAKEVVDALLEFDSDTYICIFADDVGIEHLYMECINIIPSDNYDCRCENIEELYIDYHKTAFLA